MPKYKSYETYKNVQKVKSSVANKKQTTPVRCYFYFLFHCTTSCS